MAARKRRALERIGSLSDDTPGRRDRRAVRRRPGQPRRPGHGAGARRGPGDRHRGPARLSAARTRSWRCGGASRRCSTAFPAGRYISDLHLGSVQTAAVRLFRQLLGAFVRGRVYLHFAGAEEAEAALRDAGFTGAAVRRAGGDHRAARAPSNDRWRIYLRHQRPDSEPPIMITATLYSDPACPWAYSESPALRVIEWRYGDQLDWKLVVVGLTESSEQYAQRGYTPVRGALGQLHFRSRYGMPFAPAPKARLSATARACRAVVAARLAHPGTRVGGVPRHPAGQLHRRRSCSRTTTCCATCCARSRASTPRRSSPRWTPPR